MDVFAKFCLSAIFLGILQATLFGEISGVTICIRGQLDNVSVLPQSCGKLLHSFSDIDVVQGGPYKIILLGNKHVLNRPLRFKNTSSVSIRGENQTKIHCAVIGDVGLAFKNVKNISLEKLTIENCGVIFNSTSTNLTAGRETMQSKSALYFERCTDIHLFELTMSRNHGYGIVMFNTNGTVTMQDSNFRNNRVSREDIDVFPGGGGVYIEFSLCEPGTVFGTCKRSTVYPTSGSHYLLRNCSFENNHAASTNAERVSFVRVAGTKNRTNNQALGRGGGLAIFVGGKSKNNVILIINCKFRGNSALSGGGLYVKLTGQVRNNTIEVRDSQILDNVAEHNSGGVSLSCLANTAKNSRVILQNTLIRNNSAFNGGGLLILLNYLKFGVSKNNKFEIINVTFQSNNAIYGAAVDSILYAPSGFGGPYPIFDNCTFVSNVIRTKDKWVGLSKQSVSGRGTFSITEMTIVFKKSVRFMDNSGTAMWIVSGNVNFTSNMSALFVNNTGIDGGALALVSFSSMFVGDNSEFIFKRNEASNKGGAIFSHFVYDHSYLNVDNQCSIRYVGRNSIEDSKNVTFYFEDNYAGRNTGNVIGRGSSIYMTSLHPCVFFCTPTINVNITIENMFKCIGNVTFNSTAHDWISSHHEASTTIESYSFIDDIPQTILAVPGKEFDLPITLFNELDNPLDAVYQVHVDGTSDIVIDPAYTYISNGTLKLYGHSEVNGTLVLEWEDLSAFSLTLNVKLDHCPPGFHNTYLPIANHGGVLSVSKCTCNWNQVSSLLYEGIQCNIDVFEAKLLYIYWVGYITHPALPEHLFTSFCPQHYCINSLSVIQPLRTLPSRPSVEELDTFVCGTTRTGLLCGECRQNHSIFFHSPYYKCKLNHLCSIGWLFYLLSELLPLTVLFVLVVSFNINFSSGTLNGFILFAQVVDSLGIDAYGMLEFQLSKSNGLYQLTEIYKFIYRSLNLDFFTLDSLSFCLWEGATTLDLLIFKFVTVLYAFLLILLSVLIMNKCRLNPKCPRFFKMTTLKTYIIHGLSAVLITCYVKCVEISLQIFLAGRLFGKMNSESLRSLIRVVYLNGNIEYLSREHLPYAFPAFFIILLVSLPPPALLLWYPRGRQALAKCLSLCNINTHSRCSKLNLVDKMKPLLDSFQSCYKDKFRFFAGLQFVYRVIIIATFNFADTPLKFYTAIEIELIIILVVHVIAQPYRKNWHNIVDTLIFANIALVNALSMLIYISTVRTEKDQVYVYGAVVVQTILIYQPLVYILVCVTVKVVVLIKVKAKKKKRKSMASTDDGFPSRLIHLDESSIDVSYKAFTERCQRLTDM